MRVCPKCGYIEHPAWKHCRWSYYIDTCSIENFAILHSDLAKKVNTKIPIEDDYYIYKLSKSGRWVQRKAKVDFSQGLGFSDGTEAVKSHAMKMQFSRNQRRLDEVRLEP